MASGLIDFGVGRILSVLENEVLQQTGFSDEVDAMKQKLRFMKSFLEQHGNTSRRDDKVFATFVKETRDLAYEIESIIDEFSYHVNRRRGQSWLKRAGHYPMYLQKRRSIASQFQAVKQKIQEMSQSMSTFRPETSQGTLPPPAADGGDKNWVKNLQESSFFLKDDSLVGVDEAKEELTGWLLDPDSQRIVVTVVGMGGSGKTSLAGNIFRSRHVRKHFDSYAWVTISQSYSINNVLSTMIKEFTKETGLQRGTDLSSMEYRDLVEILVDYLRDKRYFLVFDDVWSIEFWKLICVALPDGIRGSRLMITTRDERVANFSYGLESRVHPVQPLSADKAWELFCNKAFPRNREQSISPNIELIARNLVHKCRGLPLAIVTLGSMMSTRRSESEWRKVENRLNWELSNNPELKDIHRILLLSFNDLPYQLKHCFLFSSIFPEDDKIKGKSLIRMWMAQGFVESNSGVKLEEVADGYLMELVYRNLLQVVSRNIIGWPKTFKMHDIVREVALVVSKEERFCDIYNDEIEEGQHEETRHLCIQREMSSNMMTRWSIHTLLVRPIISQNIGLPEGFKLLRVLDFQKSDIEELPDSLVTLYNLKYLSLWGTEVEKLPKSFYRLVNLETLVTQFSGIDEFPVGISKLRNLRYLIADYATRMKDSSNIWQLKRLQVLDGIHVETQLIKNLGKMTKLTKIGLWKVRKDHEKDLSDSLSKLSDLRSLSLFSMDGEILPIDALSHTTKIEKLQLAGKIERLPSCFKTLHKLTRLSLGESSLGEDAMSCIGGIPNLVKLYIYNNAYKGDRLCFQEGFPCLKVLEVSRMWDLKDIVIAKGAMPHLQKLKIVYCKEVKRVPDGIESLTKLEKLSLSEASDELLERIRGENGIDRSKVNHIPIIKHVLVTEDGLISTEKLS